MTKQRSLGAPATSELRPLSARALKSVIDTLRPQLSGGRVLDLFAGQGRFGLSCLEEDAREVILVEKNGKSAAAIKKEIGRFHFEGRGRVLAMDAFQVKTETPFDIVFCDPPFPSWNLAFGEKLASLISPLLAPEGLWVVKYPERAEGWSPEGFRLQKETTFGESRLLYFRRK